MYNETNNQNGGSNNNYNQVNSNPQNNYYPNSNYPQPPLNQVNQNVTTGFQSNQNINNQPNMWQNQNNNINQSTQPVMVQSQTTNISSNTQFQACISTTGQNQTTYGSNANYSIHNINQNGEQDIQPVVNQQVNTSNSQTIQTTNPQTQPGMYQSVQNQTGWSNTPNSNNQFYSSNPQSNQSQNGLINQNITNSQGGNIPPNNSGNFNNPGIYKVRNGQTYQINQGMMTSNTKKSGGALKIIFVVAIVIGVIFLFGSKNNNGKKTTNDNRNIDYDRIIMIYMVGSNLESDSAIATADLNGLDYNKLNEQNTKVILLAGGTLKWYNDYIDVNSTSIYELTADGFKIVKKQEKKNMGKDSTLSDFLNYSYDNYAAKNYDLMLWNHGGAILGSEYDDLYDLDNLTPTELSTALSQSRFSKDNKLELVIFRTCLNGTIEIADTFKDYSNYLVASEEVTRGYYLDSLFTSINNFSKTDSGVEIGKKFIDGYMTYIEKLKNIAGDNIDSVYSTYSIIDLSKIDSLEESVNDFFSNINVSQNYNFLANIRSNLLQYGDDEKAFDMVDLYNLVNELKILSPDKANKVLTNLSSAVVYLKATDSRSKGLSIYFPYNGSKEHKTNMLNYLYDYPSLSKYKTFIQTFNNIQSGSYKKLSFDSNLSKVSKTTEASDFEIELTNDQVENFAKAGYIVFRKEKDGTYLPVYNGKNTTLEGNTLKANIKDRQLKAVDISDKTEVIANLIEQDETDDYIKYKALITLENFSDEDMRKWTYDGASMALVLNKKTGKVTMGEVKKNNKDGIYDSSIVDLNKYTNIVVASSSYKILDDKGNYINDWQSNGIIKGLEVKVKNISFELQNYDDNYEYYAIFKILDTHNNEYYTKLVKMK